jgi:hypothetical protein
MQEITKAFSTLLFLLLIVSTQSFAQSYHLKGQVIDYETRYALAFVTIQINDGPEGCISDIDGKFSIQSKVAVHKLVLSYIGYKSLEFVPENNDKDALIRMEKTAYDLPEIVITPGINPANRIISEVIANRYLNDHEHLPSFSYTSYEKMVFGPESDSIPNIDSLSADTSYLKAKEFFRKSHLFIMESVAKRSFRFPDDNYNKVVASRVSGLSDPLFVFLISEIQSTTFYKEVIKIFDKDYINPISFGCFNKYYFELQDTIVEPYPHDTTYIISYRPLKNKNFDGLKGTLSISTNGYAIRNVIAVPATEEGAISVKIQQMYEYIDSTHWFPVQLNTDVILNNSTITVDSKKKTSLKIMGRGKSYISEINLNPIFKRNQFGVYEIDVQPDAYKQLPKLWNSYRVDSLTPRDLMTYNVIDSLGKAKNFDKLSRKLNTFSTGTISISYFDLYLDNLFKVNHHEGFRPGIKLSTSDKFSSWIKIGGYVSYGFKDKEYKYGANGNLVFDRFHNFKLKAEYYKDVDEAGADNKLGLERNLLNPDSFREIFVERMDQTTCYRTEISSRILKYMTLGLGVAVYNKIPLYNYGYILNSAENITVTSSDFSFTEASLSMRYAYGEKFIRNTTSTISLGTKFPIISLYAGHGFNGMLGGQYEYNRFDLKISKSIFTKYLGTTSINFQAGFIDRDIPYVNLYNARAAYNKLFALYSPGSFATMRMDEFTSDRFASLFISHNFGTLLLRIKHFKPEPELVTNLGIGSLQHPENHQKEGIKSFEKGYFESGIVMNKILRLGLVDIGAAWFYRYGPYALPTNKENMAWKIAFHFVF